MSARALTLAAFLLIPSAAMAGGYDKPDSMAGQPAWLDTATGEWRSAPPDNRPEFQPSGPVIYKITIAADPEGRRETGHYWCKDKPLPPSFEFTTLDGRRIRPDGWIRADWWDTETARKSGYGADLDALAVQLTVADRAAIRLQPLMDAGWGWGRGGDQTAASTEMPPRPPDLRGGGSVPAPLKWIWAGALAVGVWLAIFGGKGVKE